MGKKSRAKQERRQIRESVQAPQKVVEQKESGISRFFLWVIKGSVYLALVTPLIVSSKFYFPFVGPKSLFFMGLAQMAIFSWLALIIVSPKYRPKISSISQALLIFFAILILAAILGVNFTNSFWSKFERMTGILMWFHLVGFFLVVSSVFKTDKAWKWIFTTSIGIAIIAALMALFDAGGSTRAGATLGNSSFLGTYLLFNVFFAVYLFFKQKNIYWKIGSGLAIGLLFFTVYSVKARAATLSILGGLFILVLLYLAFVHRKKSVRIIGRALLVISLIVFVGACLMLFQEGSFVRDKFIEAATRARLVVWENAWQGIQERPFLGWGPENFEFAFMKNFNPCMFLGECGSEIWFDRAHNFIFDTLITSGILGLLAFVGLFITTFTVLWKKYFKARTSFWAAAIPSVIFIAYLVQNLTVFDMISSYLMFFLTMAFANVVSLQRNDNQPVPLKVLSNRKWPLVVLASIFVITFFVFIIQPIRTGTAVIDSLQAETNESRYDAYQESFNTSPMGRLQIREFLANHSQKTINQVMGISEQEGQTLDYEAIQNELDLVTSELAKTSAESPLDFRSILKLGEIYNLYSSIDKEKLTLAEERNLQAIDLSPTNQQGYWSLSQTRLYQKQPAQALELANTAIDLEPRWFQSHSIAGQIAKFWGLTEIKEQVLEKAMAVNPDWQTDMEKVLGLDKQE